MASRGACRAHRNDSAECTTHLDDAASQQGSLRVGHEIEAAAKLQCVDILREVADDRIALDWQRRLQAIRPLKQGKAVHHSFVSKALHTKRAVAKPSLQHTERAVTSCIQAMIVLKSLAAPFSPCRKTVGAGTDAVVRRSISGSILLARRLYVLT